MSEEQKSTATDDLKKSIANSMRDDNQDTIMGVHPKYASEILLTSYIAINRYGNDIEKKILREPGAPHKLSEVLENRLLICRKIEGFLKIVMDLIPN